MQGSLRPRSGHRTRPVSRQPFKASANQRWMRQASSRVVLLRLDTPQSQGYATASRAALAPPPLKDENSGCRRAEAGEAWSGS